MNNLNLHEQEEYSFIQNYNRIFLLWIYVLIWSGVIFLIVNLIPGLIFQSFYGNSVGINYFLSSDGILTQFPSLQVRNTFQTIYILIILLVQVSRYFCAFLVLLTVITSRLDSKIQPFGLKISNFFKLSLIIVFWFSLFVIPDVIFSSTFSPLIILDILVGVFLTNFYLKKVDTEIKSKFRNIKLLVYIFCIIGLILSFSIVFVPGPGYYIPSLYQNVIVIILAISLIIIGIFLKFNLKLQWNVTS